MASRAVLAIFLVEKNAVAHMIVARNQIHPILVPAIAAGIGVGVDRHWGTLGV
ncbi:MAG: hypothetical protein ABSG40_00055 [Terriglobales bacterium]